MDCVPFTVRLPVMVTSFAKVLSVSTLAKLVLLMLSNVSASPTVSLFHATVHEYSCNF